MKSLPKGWRSKLLGDIASTITKGTTPTTVGFNFESEGIPFVKVENIESNKINHSSIYQYISGEAHQALSRSAFESGDVLFSIAGTIGKTALITDSDVPCNTNQAIAIIRGTGEVLLPLYLKYNLSYRAGEILFANARGGAMNNVSLGDLKKTIVTIPPLPEQKRIVAKLDEVLAQVDTIKARLDGIPAILKRFRQSVLAAAVSGKLTEEWRGSAELQGWQSSNIGEISIVATGKTPKRTEPKYWDDADVAWLTSSATGNLYCDSSEQHVSSYAVDDCKLKLFKPGTLLLAMYGEGKTRGQVTELKIEAACNQACAAIIVDESIALTSYVKLRLLENYEETRKAAAGGNQPNLNLNKVREIGIALPPIDEQKEIVCLVDQYFTFADTIEAQVKKAQARVDNLTQSILAKAFRGELVPQDPDDEPAEVLLTRIAQARKEADALAKAAKKAVKNKDKKVQ